jgi:hypothetical protein
MRNLSAARNSDSAPGAGIRVNNAAGDFLGGAKPNYGATPPG